MGLIQRLSVIASKKLVYKKPSSLLLIQKSKTFNFFIRQSKPLLSNHMLVDCHSFRKYINWGFQFIKGSAKASPLENGSNTILTMLLILNYLNAIINSWYIICQYYFLAEILIYYLWLLVFTKVYLTFFRYDHKISSQNC